MKDSTKVFEKFIQTVQSIFNYDYDCITFWNDEFLSLGILTSDNYLYLIDRENDSLTKIDLEFDKSVNSHDEEFWAIISKNIIKGASAKY